MNALPTTARDRPADAVAGFLAVFAMVGGSVAAVYRPVPIGIASILIAFIAAAMAERNQRLAATGVTIASLGFLTGMIASVVRSTPLW
jgi:hypothetical protein